MASALTSTLADNSNSHQVYFDPTCGAGDLLLAAARKLRIAPTLDETIADWGNRLRGLDISAEFIRLAKARLVLLAAKRCGIRPNYQADIFSDVFPLIRSADFLADHGDTSSAAFVIMNPPFAYAPAPDKCTWAGGRVNAAAIFVDKIIRESVNGTRVLAILPEVLRSGTRYERWRRMIYSMGKLRRQRPLGQFSRWVDIDVYLFDFLKFHESDKSARLTKATGIKKPKGVGRRFAVHVGPVVPHRDKEEGPKVRYIHARSLPAWREAKRIKETRRFKGRLFPPPFVAVRRTSRPGNGSRAVASLVLGRKAVAVENHLIVLLPKDQTAETCRKLMIRLQSNKTDKWINSRLRCRHLTTSILANMPWWYKP